MPENKMISENWIACQTLLGRADVPPEADARVFRAEEMWDRIRPGAGRILPQEVIMAILATVELPPEPQAGQIATIRSFHTGEETMVEGVYLFLDPRGRFHFRIPSGLEIISRPINVKWSDPPRFGVVDPPKPKNVRLDKPAPKKGVAAVAHAE